ncbi:MAG TPA: polysaccharide deacetylase family protein [Oligoflexus sp.]|uniref:polysaccharide deacetylase family protein n=1 Tax=Oligoflexus sp. TaxID=1971216 RepID=UPI002D6AE85C|nr:polysaccharide deacetylase family protein [Oligoflexus sp.]HYX33124.1 polysaccharide deacetylase family protein [Oligoflexus sp.]
MKGLATATLSLALAGCGLVKKGSSCDLTAKNLRAEPWTGAGLPTNTLSLTFLRGPSETTADIGTLLEQSGIQGSFFVRGAAAHEHQSTLHHLWEQGHIVGNGGYTFTALTHSHEPIVEVRKTDALITEDVTGNMFLFHAPEGAFSEELADLFNHNGLGKYVGPIAPDTVASDTFMDDAACWDNDLSVSACTQQYFSEIVRLQKGIIPFHDEDPRSLELLAALLPDLSAFGFSFVRLDQIPELRAVLEEAGSTVDQVAGESSCDDYD